MEVRRIRDPRIVGAVLEELIDVITDDTPITTEDINPPIDDDHRWYATYNPEGELVSLWYVHRANLIMWQIHTHYRKKFWGSEHNVAHAKKALRKIWVNTGAKKLYALVPETATSVLKLAKKTGFKQEGRIKGSYQKNGDILDQIQLGLLKEYR